MVWAVVAITAVGAVISVSNQRKARKEQKKANELSARQEAVRSSRERLNVMRQNRIQQAEVFAMAASAGVQGSSGVQGSMAGLQTQTNANIAFVNQLDELGRQRQANLDRAAGYLDTANMAETISSAASTVGGNMRASG